MTEERAGDKVRVQLVHRKSDLFDLNNVRLNQRLLDEIELCRRQRNALVLRKCTGNDVEIRLVLKWAAVIPNTATILVHGSRFQTRCEPINVARHNAVRAVVLASGL